MTRLSKFAIKALAGAQAKFKTLKEDGQGTTEYAILVGVLAVIAMIAIAAFRDRISDLWNAITSGVNGL